jgi:hypothetical protein
LFDKTALRLILPNLGLKSGLKEVMSEAEA